VLGARVKAGNNGGGKADHQWFCEEERSVATREEEKETGKKT
jgi:hypothetical protein